MLRLSPDAFWSMSVAEWNAAVAGYMRATGRTAPLTQSELAQLMQAYPDKHHE